jgi:SAGA-associated factor 73
MQSAAVTDCGLGGDQTIKVSSKKDAKNVNIKLKKAPPKHSKPGNWKDGSVVDGMAAPLAP